MERALNEYETRVRNHVLHARKSYRTAFALDLSGSDAKTRRIGLLVMGRTLTVWPAGSAARNRASDHVRRGLARSIVVAAAASVLAGEVDLGMDDTHVACQGIIA